MTGNGDAEDLVLATAPEYVQDMHEADEAIARGEHGRPLDDVMAELDQDDAW